jgi:DNA-binding protein HU-beta
MNSSELVTILAETHDVTKAQAQAILDSVLKGIVSGAASDGEVSLPGFGKFKLKTSPEREGRNPANGEKIKIAASKKLSFSPAKAVKDSLNASPRTPNLAAVAMFATHRGSGVSHGRDDVGPDFHGSTGGELVGRGQCRGPTLAFPMTVDVI